MVVSPRQTLEDSRSILDQWCTMEPITYPRTLSLGPECGLPESDVMAVEDIKRESVQKMNICVELSAFDC